MSDTNEQKEPIISLDADLENEDITIYSNDKQQFKCTFKEIQCSNQYD